MRVLRKFGQNIKDNPEQNSWKLRGEGTVLHIWRSESYSDRKHIFFIKKNIYNWSFAYFYQISYFYALFYEKIIMWKFKLNILLDLKGSCFWNRYKSKKKLTVKSGIWLLARCGLGISQRYYQNFNLSYLLAGFRRQN